MAKLIPQPSIVQAAGNPPKSIEEFVGRVNSQTAEISIARMRSPEGWSEPGQTAAFDEYTVVLRGQLRVKLKNEILEVGPSQAILVGKGEWVQYSTPASGGAEYMAICLPAFSPETVHRDF